jgi:polysaccharide biosynthesis protein
MPVQPSVVWITSGFPYGGGEQFIETEVPHWAEFKGRVIFLPENHMGRGKRPTPAEVEVDTGLMSDWHRRSAQLKNSFKALFSPVLWRELRYLFGTKRVSFYKLKHAFLSVVRVQMELQHLRRIAAGLRRPIDVVYTYWFSVGTCAAVLAQREGIVRKVVSRAHNSEYYEDARPEGYTALMRQFAPEIHTLAVISQDAAEYAPRYGLGPGQVRVCRLGVLDGPMCVPADPGTLELMSVSTLSRFKQLHIMIDAVRLVAEALPEVKVVWRHAGDGPLREELHALVAAKLNGVPNLTHEMLGHINNPDLLKLYADSSVDLFLNTSSKEGVPVSIMEAMVRGVPAIAPDVGAIREVVLPELLLPADLTPRDLADRVLAYHERAKDPAFRQQVREHALASYNADANYPAFVRYIGELAEQDG